MLELAAELSDVSKACRILGCSRSQFFEIRGNYQTHGAWGLIDRLPGARGPASQPGALEVEQAILDHCLKHPDHGALRAAQDLLLEGVEVSAGGARGVWSRYVLRTKPKCLLRPEQATASRKIELSEEQIRLPERFSPKSREHHSEARHTGDLVAADTFFLGTLKGVGESLPRA